jgi:hypothetical protein
MVASHEQLRSQFIYNTKRVFVLELTDELLNTKFEFAKLETCSIASIVAMDNLWKKKPYRALSVHTRHVLYIIISLLMPPLLGHRASCNPPSSQCGLVGANDCKCSQDLTCLPKPGGPQIINFGHPSDDWPTLLNFCDCTLKRTNRGAIELLSQSQNGSRITRWKLILGTVTLRTSTVHLQFDISGNALEIRAIQIPKCGGDCTLREIISHTEDESDTWKFEKSLQTILRSSMTDGWKLSNIR